jgi:hypothetical protein
MMNEETSIRSHISRGSRSMATAKYANQANEMAGRMTRRFENSPAIHGWVHGSHQTESPAGMAERFFRP